MQLTPEQVKGRIKNVAKENKADARTLMRIYMMERFLERVASSQYKDNFIIKGGMLVTAMVGVALRSTMDIDTSIKNQNLSAEGARRIVDESRHRPWRWSDPLRLRKFLISWMRWSIRVFGLP